MKSDNKTFVLELIKLLKPKHYVKVTWLLVSIGLFLVSRPTPSQLLNEYLKRKYQFEIFGKYDILIGFILIIIGLIYNTVVKSRELLANKEIQAIGIGGDGGGGTIKGNTGTIIGGRGGKGGVSGFGGKGGGGHIEGDGGTIIGGDGGDAGQADGRGGNGAKGPIEKFGFNTSLWGYGSGGSGVNDPEYNRRLTLLIRIQNEYKQKFTGRSSYIEAGVDRVPIDWVNQRLVELEEKWQVKFGDQGHVLPVL